MSKHLISCIIACNKNEKYLLECLESTLTQTYKKIRIVLVLNGSQRKRLEHAVRKKYKNNKLVTILHSEIEQLGFCLNLAIINCDSKYIARADGDDVNLPDRLAMQYDFLRSRKLNLCGTNLQLINETGKIIGKRVYPRYPSINKLIPFKNCFAHNTILGTKEFFISNRAYTGGLHTEDYDLWIRSSKNNPLWDNLNKELVNYRLHRGSSQFSKNSFAEMAGISCREFIKNKNLITLSALFAHLIRGFISRAGKR